MPKKTTDKVPPKAATRTRKPTGSFYSHRDWRVSHYVKVMLDQVFGQY